VRSDVGEIAQLACLLEASAPKPGNVSPGRPFADTTYGDFLASAAAIGRPFAGAGTRRVGETIRLAVEATSAWTRANTNLGIVLLLAPLARAAAAASATLKGSPHNVPMRDVVRGVLDSTTVEDARDVYAAIRRAAPGGLGRADAQDVASEPTVTLLEAMRLAADRDTIASEYVSGFEITFGAGAPALVRARCDRLSWDDAIVETYLTLLAARPDTHITRRGGAALAADVTRRATDALGAGGVRSARGRQAIDALDRSLREDGNIANPGTTADLTAAAIFVMLMDGGWNAAAR
jgi:triphosphoribosyl-dephospho-CoA synthase